MSKEESGLRQGSWCTFLLAVCSFHLKIWDEHFPISSNILVKHDFFFNGRTMSPCSGLTIMYLLLTPPPTCPFKLFCIFLYMNLCSHIFLIISWGQISRSRISISKIILKLLINKNCFQMKYFRKILKCGEMEALRLPRRPMYQGGVRWAGLTQERTVGWRGGSKVREFSSSSSLGGQVYRVKGEGGDEFKALDLYLPQTHFGNGDVQKRN